MTPEILGDEHLPLVTVRRAASFRSLVSILVVAVLGAILLPMVVRVHAYSGPPPSGTAQSALLPFRAYYAERPREPILAWTSAWGRPLWIIDRDPDAATPWTWKTISGRLNAFDAILSIAPGVVGRPWTNLEEDETVLHVDYERDGELRVMGVSKSGQLTSLQP